MAATEQIPGRQRHPEGKHRAVLDTPEARAKLAEVFAALAEAAREWLAVKPTADAPPVKPRALCAWQAADHQLAASVG